MPPWPYIKWTGEELQAFHAGVQACGVGNWSQIVRDERFSQALANRTPSDLKNRYRNERIAAEKAAALAANVAVGVVGGAPDGVPGDVGGDPQHGDGMLQHAGGDPQHGDGMLQHAAYGAAADGVVPLVAGGDGVPQHEGGGGVLQHDADDAAGDGLTQHVAGEGVPQHFGELQHAAYDVAGDGDPQHAAGDGGLLNAAGGGVPPHVAGDGAAGPASLTISAAAIPFDASALDAAMRGMSDEDKIAFLCDRLESIRCIAASAKDLFGVAVVEEVKEYLHAI